MKRLKELFKTKKVIYSTQVVPGELVKYHNFKGKRYVRIAMTNRVKFKGRIPITDVPFDTVTGIRVLPSAFKKFMYKLVGRVPRATYYKMER